MQVLSPILLEQELHLIFGEVAAVFSRTLAEAFSTLDSMVCATPHAFTAHCPLPLLLKNLLKFKLCAVLVTYARGLS